MKIKLTKFSFILREERTNLKVFNLLKNTRLALAAVFLSSHLFSALLNNEIVNEKTNCN